MTRWIAEEEFCKKMDSDPRAIYLAQGFLGGDCVSTAAFSTKEECEKWLNDPKNIELSFVIAPFVIDEPEWGEKYHDS